MSSIYCDGEPFKQFIYFQKYAYLFILRDISAATRDIFFSADEGGVSVVRADRNRVRQYCRSEKTL